MPYAYTNRCGDTHYFRKVTTKKGGRFYVTKNPEAADLIEAVPAGFEVVEYPYDAKVVIRKKVPVWVTKEEMAVVQEAMEEHSPVRDFIVVAEKGAIGIYISQFSHYF